MRLILSRKGFDSGSGGCPSPIFPDGSLYSLPIPDPEAPVTYRQIRGRTVHPRSSPGELVEDLTRGRISSDHPAHLDPDLDPTSLPRARGWVPAFGQWGAIQSHLANRGVGPGDVFLFFGLYRRVTPGPDRRWVFAADAPELHVLFGYLQVGSVISVRAGAESDTLRRHPHLRDHPHLHPKSLWPANTVYLAAPSLTLPGLSHLPGAGLFSRDHDRLRLTAPDAPSCSVWRLPSIFRPRPGLPGLTYYPDPLDWRHDPTGPGHVRLHPRPGRRGQDAVLDCSHTSRYTPALEWLHALFDA